MASSVSTTRIIRAPAEKIFEVLADPAQHPLIDGSGSVRRPLPGTPNRLSLGARFGMDMKIGLPYRITNEVVEFEEGRRVAWRHKGGHVWRYELEPVDDQTTKVTETFDWGPARAGFAYPLMRVPSRNLRAMEHTLARLAAHVEASVTPPENP